MANDPAVGAQERATCRAVARAAVYRLLSQSIAFPSAEVVEALQREDLARARELASHLPSRVAVALEAFAQRAEDIDAATLASEHRRVFSHVMSADCPPNETVYTASHIFQETQELGDLAGFYRAFELELAERERPDHISVELEFMHLLTFKEAYARVHHTQAKARLCRDAQRAFVREHLGRWARQFALLLRRKAGDGYYAAVADLLDAMVTSEIARLRVRPDAVTTAPGLSLREGVEDETCPLADVCAVPEGGAGHVRAYAT